MRITKTRGNKYRSEYLQRARRSAASRDLVSLRRDLEQAERYGPVSPVTVARLEKIARGEGKTHPYLCNIYDRHSALLFQTLLDLQSREEAFGKLVTAFREETGRKVQLDWRYSVQRIGR